MHKASPKRSRSLLGRSVVMHKASPKRSRSLLGRLDEQMEIINTHKALVAYANNFDQLTMVIRFHGNSSTEILVATT